MTKFSFEVPIKHLSDFHEDQDYTFCLSYLLEDPDYVKYIQNCERLIIDNSFNELQKPESVEKMVKLYHQFKPEAVICPDSDRWNSEELYASFQEMAEQIPINRIVPVARSLDEVDYFSDHYVYSIGVPYKFRCAIDISDFPYCGNLHFLGLNNPAEILYCRPESCDTSMPIKIALWGWSIHDWIMKACPHIHTADNHTEFFQAEMTVSEIDLAKRNIRQLKELCNGSKTFTSQGTLEAPNN